MFGISKKPLLKGGNDLELPPGILLYLRYLMVPEKFIKFHWELNMPFSGSVSQDP